MKVIIVSSAICVEGDSSATSPLRSASTSIFVNKLMNAMKILEIAKVSTRFLTLMKFQNGKQN